MRPAWPFVKWGLLVIGASALAVALVTPRAPTWEAPAATGTPNPRAGDAVLYCEFYNFVGRAPKVGFTFGIGPGGNPVFTQSGQIDADGSRFGFDDAGAAPLWSYEATENPAVLTSPDGAIRINLYDYDPARRGTTWFEAGLRSIQYLNLDGKCRQSGV